MKKQPEYTITGRPNVAEDLARAKDNRARASRFCTWSAVILPTVFLGAGSEPHDGATRAKLKEATPPSVLAEVPDAVLAAFLEVDPLQPDVGRGLHFALVISNEGQTRVDLIDRTRHFDDVFEFLMNIRLTNEEGTSVELPQPPSIVQVCTKDSAEFRARWSSRRQVERIDEADKARGESVKTPADADDGVVTLAPGEQYRLAYRIKHILAEPKKHDARKSAIFRGEVRPEPGEMERPPLSVIRPGRYGISVYAQVPGRVGEKEFRRYFEPQEPLAVQLGQE
jgi:hypothetical protein